MTSHDVISVLRRITKIKQIGHTGTLDPMAQGVLPVAISKASRLIEYLHEDKGYIAELQFGIISDTYDMEGKIEKFSEKKLSEVAIIDALKSFEGEIEQIPPAYSAVHYNGKRLYELARSGNIPDDIPKRNVFISEIKLLSFDETTQKAQIRIDCSKGTYIRSIVNDLGMILETGAVMTALERTKSGFFAIDSAVHLDDIKTIEDVEANLIDPLEVLGLNCYNLSEVEYVKIKHGQTLTTENEDGLTILVYDSKIAAIAEQTGNLLKVKKVFGE